MKKSAHNLTCTQRQRSCHSFWEKEGNVWIWQHNTLPLATN
uniref:Uncharacterized protein n=1 Tax=Anguilla anguilla TaxID=7936 RepID=A0A0E9T2B1_ANGAN